MRVVVLQTRIVDSYALGALSIREIQEAFPERHRPAYSTVQTTVYRLERKKALRRARKISNAHIFEACVSLNAARAVN
jgi:BlaI family penicillinase repressor